MTVIDGQLDLLSLADAGLCCYGGAPGKVCRRPATHEAQWWCDRPPYHGGMDCCLDHANYYATAWCDAPLWLGWPVRDAAAIRPLAGLR